jgi:hypothetical protein
MTIIVCALGALLGLVIALVCGKLALPFVLAKQAEQSRAQGREVTILGVPVGQATIFVYRFVMPFVFAVVGAVAAYQIFVGGSR